MFDSTFVAINYIISYFLYTLNFFMTPFTEIVLITIHAYNFTTFFKFSATYFLITNCTNSIFFTILTKSFICKNYIIYSVIFISYNKYKKFKKTIVMNVRLFILWDFSATDVTFNLITSKTNFSKIQIKTIFF